MVGIAGRVWYGNALLYDEAYKPLQDISMLNDPKAAKGSSTSGQTIHAGWFNKLCQYGKSDHETKTGGSHGGLGVRPVSTTWTGNLHATPVIEMASGERGDHGCQAKARVFFATGMPIQPHACYKEYGSTPLKGHWVPIPLAVQDAL